MTYGFGKTFTIPAQFTALNGCLQYFTLTANVDLISDKEITDESSVEDKMEVAVAQANLMRVLEVLRTYGGQPVITRVGGAKGDEHKVVEFTLEQANVYGRQGQMQVSEKDMVAEAIERIEGLFANVKAVKGEEKGDSFELVASEDVLVVAKTKEGESAGNVTVEEAF